MSADSSTASAVPGNILSGRTVPDKPTLDGIEDKWASAWEMGRVVQV